MNKLICLLLLISSLNLFSQEINRNLFEGSTWVSTSKLWYIEKTDSLKLIRVTTSTGKSLQINNLEQALPLFDYSDLWKFSFKRNGRLKVRFINGANGSQVSDQRKWTWKVDAEQKVLNLYIDNQHFKSYYLDSSTTREKDDRKLMEMNLLNRVE